MIRRLWNSIRASKFLKNLSVYFISKLVTALLPIIIIPVISRTLSLEDYGSYSLYKTVFGFLIPVIGLSFSNAVLRKFFSIPAENFKSYMLSLITVILATGSLVLALFHLNIDQVMVWLKVSNPLIVYFAVYVAFFTTISGIMMSYFRAIKEPKKFLISNLIVVVITLAGVLSFMYFGELTLKYLLFVHLLAIVCSVLYNAGLIFINSGNLRLDYSYMKDTFNYCLPLVVYSLLAQVYASSDRFLINYYLGKEQLALYSAGLQMAFAIPIIGQSLQLAWTPHVFESLKKDSIGNPLKRLTRYLMWALTGICVLYTIAYPFIFKIFLPAPFHSVLSFYFLFIIAGLFQSLYWLYSPFLLYYEKNVYFIFITLVSAVISLGLNLIFIENGILWVAGIFALSWAIQFVSLILVTGYVKNSQKTI